MAVKFLSNTTETKEKNEESLQRRIAIVVDWFYALKQLVDDASRPCIRSCHCDQTKDFAVKIRCIGGILMDWSVESGVSNGDILLIDQHLANFSTALGKLIAVKISFDEPSTAALLLAKTEKPISVVFEAVESIVKFIKELFCVPACAFDRCQVKLNRLDSQQKLRGKVVYTTNPARAKRISVIGTSEADSVQPPEKSSSSSKAKESRRSSCDNKNKIAKESVQKIIQLLEKKRKWVKPDGLHQFVLWREAYKGAKILLKKRRSRRFINLSSKIGNFTRLTCGRIGTSFYSAFL